MLAQLRVRCNPPSAQQHLSHVQGCCDARNWPAAAQGHGALAPTSAAVPHAASRCGEALLPPRCCSPVQGRLAAARPPPRPPPPHHPRLLHPHRLARLPAPCCGCHWCWLRPLSPAAALAGGMAPCRGTMQRRCRAVQPVQHAQSREPPRLALRAPGQGRGQGGHSPARPPQGLPAPTCASWSWLQVLRRGRARRDAGASGGPMLDPGHALHAPVGPRLPQLRFDLCLHSRLTRSGRHRPTARPAHLPAATKVARAPANDGLGRPELHLAIICHWKATSRRGAATRTRPPPLPPPGRCRPSGTSPARRHGARCR